MISDAWLRACHRRVRAVVEEKSDRDGLSCRVSLKGKIVFQLRFRYDSKHCRVDVGTYPLISLKEARELSQRYRAELEKGHDPRIIKRMGKQANIDVVTLNAVFTKWYDAYCVHKKKGAPEILRTFELYVLPSLGKFPIDGITADNWLTLMEAVARIKPAIATRILTNTKQLLSWAHRRQLAVNNPMIGISARHDLNIINKPGSRSLSDYELTLLFDALEHSRMVYKNKLFLRLCLIYGCRNGELRLAKKSHFDFTQMTWKIPAENHKTGVTTGKPLVRPITESIKTLLIECLAMSEPGDYLFNNTGSNAPMGRSAPLSLPYNIMQWLRKNRGLEMQHWSIHDLRKTARTNFSTLTQPHIAEFMLGHKMPGQWGVYDQHLYLEEQKACLKAWLERLSTLTALP